MGIGTGLAFELDPEAVAEALEDGQTRYNLRLGRKTYLDVYDEACERLCRGVDWISVIAGTEK